MLIVCPPHTTVPAGGAGPHRRWQGESRHLGGRMEKGNDLMLDIYLFFVRRHLFDSRDEGNESLLDL